MQTLTGRIVKFLPKQEGDSTRGHWVKAGFVIEYGDEYPKKAAFGLFGEERMQQCKGLKEGDLVQVSYNPESREYNERWYTELNCIRLSAVGETEPEEDKPAPAQTPDPAPKKTAHATSMPSPDDDQLPF
jgi:hypothetical protein